MDTTNFQKDLQEIHDFTVFNKISLTLAKHISEKMIHKKTGLDI